MNERAREKEGKKRMREQGPNKNNNKITAKLSLDTCFVPNQTVYTISNDLNCHV